MKKFLCLFLSVLCFSFPSVGAVTQENLNQTLHHTAQYLLKTVPSPEIGTLGGDWTILGLSRSGLSVPEDYFPRYYSSVLRKLQEENGILHRRKHTEYARVILALTAIGISPEETGYNLFLPLYDTQKTSAQGINGSIWALLALDCTTPPPPTDTTTDEIKSFYIQELLSRQTPNGGWALSGNEADADITAMVLQALSPHQQSKAVQTATDRGISLLSSLQQEDGGFTSGGIPTAESCAQVLIALGSLGISPEDSRFLKNGYSVCDALLAYQTSEGAFYHTKSDTLPNLMTTEQCLCALASINRFQEGKSGLYQMTSESAQRPLIEKILLQIRSVFNRRLSCVQKNSHY